MNDDRISSWEKDQMSQVDSWWGAVAALMLLQAYSFILLQGLVHFTVFGPVTFVFLFFIALSQAGGLRVMDRYLKTHDWRTTLRFWHSPLETLKFCAAILSAAIYLYLLTGHKPIPRDPALYANVGILGNLAFQLFNLAIAFVLNWIWKLASAIGAARLAGADTGGQTGGACGPIGGIIATVIGVLSARRASADAGAQTGGASGLVGGVIATVIGVLLVVVSCYAKDFFYIFGVIGYGMIVLALSAALTRDPGSWVVKEQKISPDKGKVGSQ